MVVDFTVNSVLDNFLVNTLTQTYEEALGPSPPFGKNDDERKKWLLYQKRKWAFQRKQKRLLKRAGRRVQGTNTKNTLGVIGQKRRKTIYDQFWHVISISPIGENTGDYRLWAMIGDELHPMTITVPSLGCP